MQQLSLKHAVVIITLLLLGTAGVCNTAHAGSGATQWPLARYLNEQSILARYFLDFAKQYPDRDSSTQLQKFCELLSESDLLADRLSMLGGKPSEMHSLLGELRDLDLKNISRMDDEDHALLRGLLQSLDIQLESIDHSLSTGTRKEFRREVLADVPPLNRVG